MTTPRYCLDCDATVESGHTRCDRCRSTHERATRTARRTASGRNRTRWAAVRKAAITQRPACERCGHTGSDENPLEGHDPTGRHNSIDLVEVLCKKCHGRESRAHQLRGGGSETARSAAPRASRILREATSTPQGAPA